MNPGEKCFSPFLVLSARGGGGGGCGIFVVIREFLRRAPTKISPLRRRLPSSARQSQKRKLMRGNHRCSLSPPPEIMNHKVVQTIREMTLLNLRPPVGGGRSSSNLPFPSFVGGRLAARPKGQVDEGRDSSWALDKQFRPADVSSSYLSFSTGVDRIKWTS